MNIIENEPLRNHSTMRLGGSARYCTEITSLPELEEALAWAKGRNLPALVLGGGSNVIFTDHGFSGLLVLNRIPGFSVVVEREDEVVIQVGAGEEWDSVVARTVERGWSGIEALSLIPGTAGATPVQNVGAYGQEISQTLLELTAYDRETERTVTLSNEECGYSYRTSVFNGSEKGRYVILDITLALGKKAPQPPFYAVLDRYLQERGIAEFSVATIREAVIAIRSSKLPDPKRIANTGSFFKNPLVSAEKAAYLAGEYPDMPNFPQPDGRVKLSAGWLIDKTGLKGYAAHGMKIYEKNALVFVNDSAERFADLAAFKEEVVARVNDRFGIILEQEPETVDFS